MITSAEENPIPKIVALILVCIGVALVLRRMDTSILARMNLMSPGAYVERARHFYQHSFLYHYLIVILFGGFFLGAVEFVAHLVGLLFKKTAKPPYA
jgi:hypothetical protein